MGLGAAIAGVFAALTTTTGSLTALGTVVAAALEAAISLGVSALSSALSKPKAGNRPGRKENVRSSTMAHQVVLGRVRKGGLLGYLNGVGAKNKLLYVIVVFAAHKCRSIGPHYLGGQSVEIDPNQAPNKTPGNVLANANPADVNFRNYAFLVPHLGDPNQAADAELIDATAGGPGQWTAAHRLRGRCYTMAMYRESPAKFGSIPPLTAIIEGFDEIYDPRDNTSKWSDNPALQCAWIAERFMNYPRERIHKATLIQAANDCDALITNKDGTTSKRFTSNYFFELEGDPDIWLDPALQAMAGSFLDHDGILYIQAGTYKAPELTLTDADFIGGGEIVLRTAESNITRSNGVKGTYVGADAFDTETEFPFVRDAAMIAEDGGVENLLDIGSDLEACNDHRQAQRVAQIILRKQRSDTAFSVDVHPRFGLDVKATDVVSVDSHILGIEGTFVITNHVQITTEGPTLYVTITLQATSPQIFEWDAANDERDLDNPTLNIPNEQETPAVQIHDDNNPITVPPLGVDNEAGNDGDLVIDLKNDVVRRKRGIFS